MRSRVASRKRGTHRAPTSERVRRGHPDRWRRAWPAATAQPRGAPKWVAVWIVVPPCAPHAAMARALPMHALTGSPPPSPLPKQMTSGTTPASMLASQAPPRPRPVQISSTTSRAPASSHILRSDGRKLAGGTTQPPRPSIGSTRTHPTLPRTSAPCDGLDRRPSSGSLHRVDKARRRRGVELLCERLPETWTQARTPPAGRATARGTHRRTPGHPAFPSSGQPS